MIPARLLDIDRLERLAQRARSRDLLDVADHLVRLAFAAELEARRTEPRPVRLGEWARTHHVAARTARRWAADGRLSSAERVGGVWYVSDDERPTRGHLLDVRQSDGARSPA